MGEGTRVFDPQEEIRIIQGRINTLESVAHQPFDFTDLINRLEKLERWAASFTGPE